MAERVEVEVKVGFRCRLSSANGFEALDAVQKKARVGGHCPLLGRTVEMRINYRPDTPEADREVLASLAKCEVCRLRPQVWDITYP